MPERDVTIAKPWKQKRVIGPHVVTAEKSPVRLQDGINGVHGKFMYQWVCKYCDEEHVHLEGFDRWEKGCGEFEWLESEEIARG